MELSNYNKFLIKIQKTTAIKNEESDDKKINLTIMNKDGKITLEMISDKNFSEEIFLKNFMEKYTAEVNETNFRKKIKFEMIWADELGKNFLSQKMGYTETGLKSAEKFPRKIAEQSDIMRHMRIFYKF